MNINKLATIATTSVAVTFAVTFTEAANATEGGGSIYPVGTENYVCCALPPPGLYAMAFAQRYEADAVRGDRGQVVTPSTFRVTATALAPRIVWVTPYSVAGASLALHAIVPLVALDVRVAPGLSQRKTGLGDIVFGPALGWHHGPALHSVLALDVYAPTGRFDRGDVANIGRNHWAIQPVAGVSLIDPAGLNVDLKAMWTFNLRNGDTDYRSGQELIADYAVGWGLGNGWTLGVGGYLYRQITDDRQAGATVERQRGRAVAIGPSVKYDSGKGWFVTAKYQAEHGVRNRADGSAFWVKGVVPF